MYGRTTAMVISSFVHLVWPTLHIHRTEFHWVLLALYIVAVQLFALDKYSVKCTLRRKPFSLDSAIKLLKLGLCK
jgi:hypothetical protein